jgi:acetyl-CoA carboxylase carboxyl transferase subunit alpha
MNGQFLDFERPIVELERKIRDMRDFASEEKVDFTEEIEVLEKKLKRLQNDIYSNLTPWQRVQLARHPLRPHSLDYIILLTKDFLELHGDRNFRDDKAVVSRS